MTPQPEETAIDILVPQAEPLVAALRARFDRSAMRGMPAHITLLYPFRSPDQITSDVIDRVRALAAAHPPFSFVLTGLCGFPGTLYLVPEPLAVFDDLTRRLVELFPDRLPYGGSFPDPMPHLTVAQQPPAPSLEELSRDLVESLGAQLPLRCEATQITMAVKQSERWAIGHRFPFEGAELPTRAVP